MAEKYECKEQVVNVRFMNRQENKGQIHLWRGEKKKKKKTTDKNRGTLFLF